MEGRYKRIRSLVQVRGVPKTKNNKPQAKAVPKKQKGKSKDSANSLALSIGRSIGAAIGSSFGPTGAKIGGALGGTAMSKLSHIVGRGDYTMSNGVRANSLVKGNMPVGASFGNGSERVRVRDRECLGYVYAQGDSEWTPSVHVCQPGLVTSFPKLANQAGNFISYKMHGLVYELVSNVSEYSSNSVMGQIVVTFDPNQGSSLPASAMVMQNMNHCVSEKPSVNMIYAVECDPKELPYNEYFTRSGDSPGTANAVEDFGKLIISTAALPPNVYTAGMKVATLYVTYDVELMTSKLPAIASGQFYRGGYNADPTSQINMLGASNIRLNRSGAFAETYVGTSNEDFPANKNAVILKNTPIGTVFSLEFYVTDPVATAVFNTLVITPYGVQEVDGLVSGTAGRDSGFTVVSDSTYFYRGTYEVIGHPTSSLRSEPLLAFSYGVSAATYTDFLSITLTAISYGLGPATAVPVP